MFERKIWKKGNKITTKELNRIEEGIEEGLRNQASTANENIDNNSTIYVTVDTSNVNNIENTDGAEISENAFSMSFENIISNYKSGK